jgi:hypothetical protein
MLRYLLCLMTAALILPAGCIPLSGGSNQIIRDVPLEHWGHIEGSAGNPVVVVIRDADCWLSFVGSENEWNDLDMRQEALEVDFEQEMVVVAMMSGGCSIDCRFTSAMMRRGRLVLNLLAFRGTVTSMLLPCWSVDREAIVVPRSDEWVTVHELSINWPFVVPRTYYAAEVSGPCQPPDE